MNNKPLGKRKAYGSIPHFVGSKLGPGDHHCPEGQAKICMEKKRDKHDEIIVQEKVDGACCAVLKLDDAILPLNRAGYSVYTSDYIHHLLFGYWVECHYEMFMDILSNGERMVGEWLALVHTVEYDLQHPPFVPFDLMVGSKRYHMDEFLSRLHGTPLTHPHIIHQGDIFPKERIEEYKNVSFHGAKNTDELEGLIFRVYRKEEFDFIAKFVNENFEPGKQFESYKALAKKKWNWNPFQELSDKALNGLEEETKLKEVIQQELSRLEKK